MAMELFVLSDERLNSIGEWQEAISEEGYPLRLDDTTPIGALKGFLPARLRDNRTGFECSHWPASEFMREMSAVNFGHNWRYLLTFRWGGDLDQVQAAWMAAAAYANATHGIVFDEQEGKICTAVEARAIAREIERNIPNAEAILQELKRL